MSSTSSGLSLTEDIVCLLIEVLILLPFTVVTRERMENSSR